jgi:cobaltochelatase CobS
MPISVATETVSTASETVCTIEGCEDKRHAKGYCTFHYNSFRNHGDPLAASRMGKKPRRKAEAKPKPAEAKPAAAKRPAVASDATRHPAFDEVCELLEDGENVMLVGPAGTGKSYLAEQVAKHRGQRFGSISCSAGMSESHLIGRMVPMGDAGQFEFLSTEFLECFEQGGVFLLDEMDSADPNVLLVINGALANGRISVPARNGKPVAMRHPEFVLIAACNTFGRGADRQYVGRSQLDESTLDRFRIGTIECDYCEKLERRLFIAIAGEDAAALDVLSAIWKYRAAVVENRLERCVSTRFVISAAKAVKRGRNLEYITDKLTNGWRADEKRKVIDA